MKIATYNVNGIRARLPRLGTHQRSRANLGHDRIIKKEGTEVINRTDVLLYQERPRFRAGRA